MNVNAKPIALSPEFKAFAKLTGLDVSGKGQHLPPTLPSLNDTLTKLLKPKLWGS
jgi:hypothetical protein